MWGSWSVWLASRTVFGAGREAYLSVALARIFLLEVMAFFTRSPHYLTHVLWPTFPCSVRWGTHAWFALGWRGFSGACSDRAFDVRRWGSGRVDIELIALAAQNI